MIKYFLTGFALLISLCGYTQKSYIDYHKQINLAERRCFVEQDIKGGLSLYQSVFSSFNFVYAGDCMIAMQLALFVKDEPRFRYFAQRAFENGFPWHFFRAMPYVAKSEYYLKDSAAFKELYATGRIKYLSHIDTSALKIMVQAFVDDQLSKNYLKDGRESESALSRRYAAVFESIDSRIRKIIKDKGLPMDRIIGLPKPDIMKELKLNCPDVIDYYYRYKNSCSTAIGRGQFTESEWDLSARYYLTITVHQQNMLNRFDSANLLQQITLGNIHPKDVAFLHSNFYNGRQTPAGFIKPHFLIGFSYDRLSPNCGPVADSVVNQSRFRFFLPPIEQDRAKWKFMLQHKMTFIWGYAGIRT